METTLIYSMDNLMSMNELRTNYVFWSQTLNLRPFGQYDLNRTNALKAIPAKKIFMVTCGHLSLLEKTEKHNEKHITHRCRTRGPKNKLCKVPGKVTCSRLWLNEQPKVKLRRLSGKIKRSRCSLKLYPRVKL